MEYKLELIPIPVSDVDASKSFYTEKAGFVADHDRTVGEDVRFVQLTPPGSACSIAFGVGVTSSAPGSAQGMVLVVDDIDAAHAELVERGLEIGEVQQMPWGARHAFFDDPDGNSWSLQAPG